jgi:hypothetical protein
MIIGTARMADLPINDEYFCSSLTQVRAAMLRTPGEARLLNAGVGGRVPFGLSSRSRLTLSRWRKSFLVL